MDDCGDESRRQYIGNKSDSEDGWYSEEGSDSNSGEHMSIRRTLQTLFKEDLASARSFSFHRASPEAPNPCITIKGLGTVGLPLNVRDAEAIKGRAEQAPFGKANKTVVDKTVRDTWEIDSKLVHFENRAWAKFMDQVILDVCQALGVNHEASQPRCNLHKLLLYEKGSHFLPHVDTEKENGMFATIVVVLPSKFNGGAVHVSHGDSKEVYDCSANSLTDTTMLAWYTDVQHEVKRITSGYRLALSFNLVHTTKSLRPAVSSQSRLSARLGEILRLWKDGEDAPKKIVYLLSHKYSQANLTGSALKGADAQLVSTLDSIARPLGFHLGLASLKCIEHGFGYEEDRDGNALWAGVNETSVVIRNLVDLDGKRLAPTFKFDPGAEVIPDKLASEIVAGGYDDERDHGGYMGNEGANIDRIYLRTVLVIWPSRSNLALVHGDNAFKYAREQLGKSITTEPSDGERDLVQLLLDRHGEADKTEWSDLALTICRTACRWKDPALWIKAIKKRGIIGPLANATIKGGVGDAVNAFGFDKIRDDLKKILDEDESDVGVLRFLEDFETWTIAQNPSAVTRVVKDWIFRHRIQHFENLSLSVSEDRDTLVALAIVHGGVDLLENTVIPQVQRQCHGADLPLFALSLSKVDGISHDERTEIAKGLLNRAITDMDIYGWSPYGYSSPSDVAKAYIRACVELDCEELLPAVLHKVALPDTHLYRLNREVLISVLDCLVEIASSRPQGRSLPDLAAFCQTAVESFAEAELSNPRAVFHVGTQRELLSLMKSVTVLGHSDLILTKILPALEQLNLDAPTIQKVVKDLRASMKSTAKHSLEVAVQRLLKQYANKAPLPIADFKQNEPLHHVKAVIDALEYCLKMKAPEAGAILLRRFLNGRRMESGYVKFYSGPLLCELQKLLQKHRLRVSSPEFAPLLRNLLLEWVDKVLGPKPTDTVPNQLQTLGTWRCDCIDCPQVRQFLSSDPEQTKTFPALGAVRRTHLEKFLRNHAMSISTWWTVQSRPQGLTIKKNDNVVAPVRWTANQNEGALLLHSIATELAEQQVILGTEYGRVFGVLALPTAPPQTAVGSASRSQHPGQAAGPSFTELPPNGKKRRLGGEEDVGTHGAKKRQKKP
ncbi:hypothetical protein C8Q74DRAFT_1237198 [Fomes fomentarius]|nr:hypothetical protein C8Q74DRAFT_1237198 [Fomes fomentarius]